MTRRGVIGATAVTVVLAAAVVGTVWWSTHRAQHSTAAAAVPVATAAVVRTDLASTTQLSGTLGFAGSYTVPAQGAGGTITALPRPGQVLSRGWALYEVDGSPVYLFYGARPLWRTLASGVTPGADVLQLEQNLTALGYADASDLTVDDTFTWATSEAIRRWQQATGQTITGQVALGTLSYQPGPIRVSSVQTSLGSPAQPGQPVLTATSPTPVVTVPVPPGQTYLVHAGDAVTVTLPAGNSTPGRVDSISSVAVSGQSNSSTGSNGPQSGSGQSTVPALVTLTDPSATAHLDQAPVTVNVTDRKVSGVLAVPITALVALAGGGYGVYVDQGAGRQLVAVTPGLFATSLVQVTATELHVGDLVEVPAQ